MSKLVSVDHSKDNPYMILYYSDGSKSEVSDGLPGMKNDLISHYDSQGNLTAEGTYPRPQAFFCKDNPLLKTLV